MKTSLPFEYNSFKQLPYTLVGLLVVVDNNQFTVRGNIKCRAGPFFNSWRTPLDFFELMAMMAFSPEASIKQVSVYEKSRCINKF